MGKTGRPHFVCQACGTVHVQWAGRCDACLSWNTLNQETANPTKAANSGLGLELCTLADDEEAAPRPRLTTGCAEFDRVCGGGLVPGSVVLVGGDPGIGKSTLLLQMACALSPSACVLYLSGEEGVPQIRLRAKRLGLVNTPIQLGTGTRAEDVIATLQHKPKPQVVVVDSIQTLSLDSISGVAGTVSQIRACTGELIRLAKQNHTAIILIGHVTKEGVIAGPRLLEHMVDTVLYFEGDRGHPFRLLRAVKNRFGPTDEVGVFDMTSEGFVEVENPSALFLSHRAQDATGTCVFPGIEGTRPLLVEIQALASPSFLSSPRRSLVGWDSNRLSMILAVLETRLGLQYSKTDIYLNVVGGLRIGEPAADLAVALALISCLKKKPIPQGYIAFGEIGLSGEIRPVHQGRARLKEAAKLGFSHGLIPHDTKSIDLPRDLELIPLQHIRHLIHWFSLLGESENTLRTKGAHKRVSSSSVASRA